MIQYLYPSKGTWGDICKRPFAEDADIDDRVSAILNEVKVGGDQALKNLAELFDKVKLNDIGVSDREFLEAKPALSSELKKAIDSAYQNIFTFHKAQLRDEPKVETMPGVQCWRKNVAIENVGVYIPGGTAPLFSTVLMLAIPAKIAGCKNITLCTPCDKTGKVYPAVLYAAKLCGVNQVYKIGGAQAIAAMAYGTESIAKVNKIFGPGNRYVTKAKELVQKSGIAIDMPAGPSEVLVVADKNSNPDFVAADLLSQAEHGVDSQVVLVTDCEEMVPKVKVAIDEQLSVLPRKEIAEQALNNSLSVVLNSMDECIDFSNAYAPEHLILSMEDAENYVDKIVNAGSVFLGKYSCESAGDYASGTNHTLPTNTYSKAYSGVSVDSFIKKITFQKLTEEGLQNIGAAIETMAEAEHLQAHKNAVSIRLNQIKDNK